MAELELSVGTIDYLDLAPAAGAGPTLVFLHGLLMDATLWSDVTGELAADHRCVVPTLPLGAHRRAVAPDADLTLPGLARLVAELLAALDLTDVTLVGNDTGGALAQLVLADPELRTRVTRAVLVSCEAFDNLPPALTGRTVAALGKLPPSLFGLFMQQMRLKPARRTPMAFGRLTRRGDRTTRGWLQPILGDRAIRRDAVRVLRSVFQDREVLNRAAERLPGFDRPVLVVWAAADRVMPPEHGRRLAALFPDARLLEVEDSATLVALDQPAELAAAVRGFVAG